MTGMVERGNAVAAAHRRNGYYPDEYLVKMANFFFQAPVGHIVLLHGAGLKSGFCVNGHRENSPFRWNSAIQEGKEGE